MTFIYHLLTSFPIIKDMSLVKGRKGYGGVMVTLWQAE